MAVFYFPQYEHEIFWRYLSRLNEFHDQYVDHYFEKWKICEVIFDGLNNDYRGHVETMYPKGLACLLARAPNEIWDSVEYLAHAIWEYDNASETIGQPITDPYMMHAECYTFRCELV